MDLLRWLEENDSDLSREVANVRAEVKPLLENAAHRYYTDHSISHSDRVIVHLGALADGLVNSSEPLSRIEAYILLAATYLHDIGMQDEICGGLDLESRRFSHHELADDLIHRSIEKSAESVSLGLLPEPDIVHTVAMVVRGHRRVDLNDDEYDRFLYGDQIVRPRLLAALLRLADELDIDHRRVVMTRLGLMSVSHRSQLHWYKHHYVRGVGIANGYITIGYRVPKGDEYTHYRRILDRLVHHEVEATLEALRPIFRDHGLILELQEATVREIPGLDIMPPEVESRAVEACHKAIDEEMFRLQQEKSAIPSPPVQRDQLVEKMIDV